MSIHHSAIQIQENYVLGTTPRMFGAHFGNGYAHGIVVIPEEVFGTCEVRDQCDEHYIYQALYRRGKLVGTNDPKQLRRHLPFIQKAKGEILVTNVGPGGFLYRLLRKPEVVHVTVAEPDFEIMELVEPSFSHFADKVTFVNARWEEMARCNIFDEIYLG